MEDENHGVKAKSLLDELSLGFDEEDGKQWFVCISLGILTEELVHPYMSHVEKVAANYLNHHFSDRIVDNYWQLQAVEKQYAVLYGLLYLIGSNSKDLVRDAAQNSLKRLMLAEIKARNPYFFPLLGFMKDVEEAKGHFEDMTKRWMSQRNVTLKLDSFVQGLSLLISLMEMEPEQAAGNTNNTTVSHTCRLISYFILVNDHEPKKLLSFIMETLDPTCGGAKDDGLWNWLKTAVNLISSSNVLLQLAEGGGVVLQELTEENVVECFVKYTENKKEIVCALLLRCVLLDTPYGGQVNLIIIAIERAFSNARFWGLEAFLASRLRMILREQRELGLIIGGNKKIKPILDTFYALASNLDTFGLPPAGSVIAGVDVLIQELLEYLNHPNTSEDAQVIVLRCLIIYMNRQRYPLYHGDYIQFGKKLTDIWFTQEELAQLLGELKDKVNANIEETFV